MLLFQTFKSDILSPGSTFCKGTGYTLQAGSSHNSATPLELTTHLANPAVYVEPKHFYQTFSTPLFYDTL
jgi:hypothetical protein